ncbi:MAG: sensor domain-containing diguanylate cyclase [Deltaproteobacteria bacterium]
MKKTIKKNGSPTHLTLRQRAEEIALETADVSPENIDGQTPAEIRQTLHDMRVHQIELDMQKEELCRAQAEIEASRARYFDLYDLAPVGYITLSKQGLILEANLTAATLLGAQKKNLSKRSFSWFILKEDQDIYYLHRKLLLEIGEPQACELRMVKMDGLSFWAHLQITAAQNPSENPGQADGKPVYRVVLSDITSRKKAEETTHQAKEKLEETNRELEQALAREQQLARTDGLTGIYNRRYFFELATREFSAALRYLRPLSIILFDADNLKQINDSFGHQVGDRLLALLAKTAAEQLRAVDELARYGGDEFIVLLPQTSAQQAFPIAERIREQTAAIRMETGRDPCGVTLSMGIAGTEGEPGDSSIEAVISRADKALYQAKAEGRNRAVIYGEEKKKSIDNV